MPEGDLKAVTEKYSACAPKPLNTQFPDRRGKEEAVQLHAGRKKRMATELYPPAEEQENLLASCQSSSVSSSGGQTKKRKTPTCSKCGKLVKGHHRENNVLICPSSTSQETD